MKTSIQFSLMMALLIIIGPIHLNAQTKRIEKQNINKNRLEQVLEKYEFDFADSYQSHDKAYVVQVDSMISTYPESDFEKEKQVKTYYESGKLHTHTFLYLNNNEWENSNRYVNTYNDDGKLLEQLNESWEEDHWKFASKTTTNYNDSGERQSKLREIFQDDNWENSRLSTYGYDSNNHLNLILFQKWEDNGWLNFYLITSVNNENGWWINDLTKVWQDGEWLNTDSTVTVYNDYGDYISFDSKIWQENEWVNGSLSNYRYDSEQRQTSNSSSFWSENEYMKFRIDSTTYNEDGLEDTKLLLIGNEANEWEHAELEQRIYDENLNLIEQTIQLWENEQWNNGFMGEYVFEEGSIAGTMYEWIDDNWEDCTQYNRYLYYILEGEYIHRGYTENSLQLYYSDVQVGIDKPLISQSQLEAYPNPTTGLYHIKMVNDNIKTIDVYQLNSQLVASYKIDGSQEFQLDLSDMPNGIYMIKVQSEKHITVLKTVKSN